MRGVYLKELFRTIRSSLGRFLAIFGIVALGCGFYAGLGMAGVDMRYIADAFFDGCHLYDIRLVSTMGITQEQMRLLADVNGIEATMPAYALDVMATLHEEQCVMRVTSFDVEQAKAGQSNELGNAVASEDASYLNRLVLADGRWPQAANECVASSFRAGYTVVELGDTVEVLYGASDLDGVLEERTYTVVGLVNTPSFASSTHLGYTNLGSGTVQQYIYVMESAFAEDIPYTELYISAQGAREERSYSDSYQAIVDDLADALELRSDDIAASRLAQVKADAQEELDEKKEEYETEKADAQAQLDDAKAQLDDAAAELDRAAARIASGESDLAQGRAELASSRASAYSSLEAGRRKLEDAARELDAGEEQLGMTQADIDAARAQVADGRSQIEAGEQEFQAAQAAWTEQRAGLVAAQGALDQLSSAAAALAALGSGEGIPSAQDLAAAQAAAASGAQAASTLAASGLLDEAATAAMQQAAAGLTGAADAIAAIDISAIDPTDPASIAALQAQLAALAQALPAESLAGLDAQKAQLQAGIEQGDAAIAGARAELDARTKELDTAAAQLDEAQAARYRIDAGREELARGWEEYYAQEARAARELSAAQAQLDAAAAQLEEGRQELAEGREEYEQGLAEYEDSRKRAEGEFADAAAQIAEAQADIDSIEAPDVYILDRTKNISVASYNDDSVRIDNIARLFPLIFFLVAALVALTTMTRMVEDERIEIGTHKALGFTTAQITMKYVLYALIAGLSGALVGIGILSQVLPYVVMVAYGIMYTIPIPPLPLPINLPLSALAIAAGLGITLLATWGAAAATLREVPAQLMLPRAPAKGKRILLEHVGIIWHNLSFSWKVTMRNLFRYKRRLAMTIIGVAGCTALLLTGLGLHDSIWDIIEKQFEGADPISVYTTAVGVDPDTDEARLDEVHDILEDVGGADLFTRAGSENMQAASASNSKPFAISVIIPLEEESFTQLIHLRNRLSGESIPFDSHSVVISEKAATMLGVQPGDTVYVYEQDDIGNAVGRPYEFRVDALTEHYVRHFLYVGQDAWQEITGRSLDAKVILANVNDEEQARAELSHALHELDEVSTVAFNSEAIETYRTSLSSVNMVVVVLVVAAAALAFIVLYNLTNINIIERTREIASLKVLGFTRFDVFAYVFREISILVILGAGLGLLLGIGLESFVVLSSEVDVVMFGREIHPPSFGIAFVMTLVFSVLVMLSMLPKLHHIDMVESLKSVD